MSAQVVGKDFTEFFRVTRVVLDKGARDVRPHMPVVSPDGVVGAVLHVAGDTVDVQLAVDAAFGVDVEDERTRARGFVRGTGDPARYGCKVEMVDSRDEVEIGDLLVTSGKGRWFPTGIPVARVTKVIKRELGRDQDVEAAPDGGLLAPRRRAHPRDHAGRGDRPAPRAIGASGGPREAVMRNVAFLALGLALLVLQANVFRVLDGVPAGVAIAWLLAVLLDVARMCGRCARRRGTPARSPPSAPTSSLPATVLLGYALLVASATPTWAGPSRRSSCRSSSSWGCTSTRSRAARRSPSSSAT